MPLTQFGWKCLKLKGIAFLNHFKHNLLSESTCVFLNIYGSLCVYICYKYVTNHTGQSAFSHQIVWVWRVKPKASQKNPCQCLRCQPALLRGGCMFGAGCVLSVRDGVRLSLVITSAHIIRLVITAFIRDDMKTSRHNQTFSTHVPSRPWTKPHWPCPSGSLQTNRPHVT